MTVEHATILRDALRSGRYKQGRARLRDCNDGFCAMGVLANELGMGWRKVGGLLWRVVDPEVEKFLSNPDVRSSFADHVYENIKFAHTAFKASYARYFVESTLCTRVLSLSNKVYMPGNDASVDIEAVNDDESMTFGKLADVLDYHILEMRKQEVMDAEARRGTGHVQADTPWVFQNDKEAVTC